MMRLTLLFVVVATLAACGAPPASIRVIDGDTVEYRGENIRLMGFDTPETYRPGCAAERRLGEIATRRMIDLINTAQRVNVRVDDYNDRDRYGRLLGRVIVDGRDTGQILISEGLALPYEGGKREDWCAYLAA